MDRGVDVAFGTSYDDLRDSLAWSIVAFLDNGPRGEKVEEALSELFELDLEENSSEISHRRAELEKSSGIAAWEAQRRAVNQQIRPWFNWSERRCTGCRRYCTTDYAWEHGLLSVNAAPYKMLIASSISSWNVASCPLQDTMAPNLLRCLLPLVSGRPIAVLADISGQESDHRLVRLLNGCREVGLQVIVAATRRPQSLDNSFTEWIIPQPTVEERRRVMQASLSECVEFPFTDELVETLVRGTGNFLEMLAIVQKLLIVMQSAGIQRPLEC